MKKKLLHTPEGVRDIYGNEYENKLKVSNDILELIKQYGYRSIETPTIEFFDIFSSRIGTIPSNELYKFFDKEGNTLVLRPDFTPSIARATAKYFMDEHMPIRLCYMGNTFVNANDFQGKLKETTQIGAELINDGSIEADVEILLMVIETMKKCGLEDFQVSIGNHEFFKGLCEEYGIDDDKELDLREMINDKNIFGTMDILDSLSLTDKGKDIFNKMPEMFGNIEKVEEAQSFVTNSRSLKALSRLKEIYELLKLNGVEEYVSFDLGMLSKYNYYTGMIFRAYTYGSGDAIIKGGRYDNLLKEFGKDSEAVGFAIMLDQLLLALSRQKITVKNDCLDTVLLVYGEEQISEAYKKAKELRNSGNACMMAKKASLSLECDLVDFAKKNGYRLVEM